MPPDPQRRNGGSGTSGGLDCLPGLHHTFAMGSGLAGAAPRRRLKFPTRTGPCKPQVPPGAPPPQVNHHRQPGVPVPGNRDVPAQGNASQASRNAATPRRNRLRAGGNRQAVSVVLQVAARHFFPKTPAGTALTRGAMSLEPPTGLSKSLSSAAGGIACRLRAPLKPAPLGGFCGEDDLQDGTQHNSCEPKERKQPDG